MSDEQRVLAEGVLGEAREEAKKIRSDWEQSREARRASLEKRIAEVESDTAGRIEREKDRIAKQMSARIENERRRAELRLRDSIYREIELSASAKLQELMSTPEYHDVLLGWTVEAGVGLNANRALCTCSAKEKAILPGVLPEAEGRISDILGRKITLTLSDDDSLAEQGIVLTSEDGQTAFSNRVSDRLRRRRTAIRRIIHDALFGEDGHE